MAGLFLVQTRDRAFADAATAAARGHGFGLKRKDIPGWRISTALCSGRAGDVFRQGDDFARWRGR